jgi:anti-sigma B factor antagonist
MLVPPACAGHRRLSPEGDLDLATAPALRDELVELSRLRPALVVLDLERVAFLDSVGVGVIVGGYKRLRHDGARLHLAAPQSVVKRVLGLTRIDEIIPTYDSVGAAEADCPSEHLAS